MNNCTSGLLHSPLRACGLLVLASILLLCCAGSLSANSLNVQTEAEYAALIDAVRATEYTRQAYLEGDGNPRALVAVLGLLAYADRNPLVTPQQLTAFIAAYDARLQSALVGDPQLSSQGAVPSAVTAVWLPSDGPLAGTDTRVSARVLELLGIHLPGLDNYDESRLRMSRYELASVQRLVHRHETVDALTRVLAGVTAQGLRPTRLAQIAASYLTEQGLSPQLGVLDPDAVEINAGLADLPSWSEFELLRDSANAHLPLEEAVFDDIDEIQLEAGRLLSDIGTSEPQLDLFLESLSLTLAASDPSDPQHAAALAQFEARRQAIINDLRATASQRAGVFARTLLLQQSNYSEVRAIATGTRNFTALQLQTNADLSMAVQGVELGGSLIGLAAGVYRGDPWEVAQSLTGVVAGALGLADLLGNSAPAPEQQIFDQIVALRQQVEDMRVQLNERFDVVDAKLDQIFGTMTAGFAELGNQIGDLQESVDALAANIAEARSSLDRIEDALFGFAQELLLADLSQQTNLVLNYRANTGVDLPYSQTTPSFVGSASFFHTFATTVAKGVSFAGTADDQAMTLTLDNAGQVLGSTAVARRLNDLRRVPTGLQTRDGVPVTGPITASRVAAPAPWSQAAAAYAQLSRESPWYFAFLLGNQGAGSSSAQINQLITDGERITSLADATRMHGDLFEALLYRAELGVQLFQLEVQRLIELRVPGDGSQWADPWGPLEQTASTLMPAISEVLWTSGSRSGTMTVNASNFAHRGHELAVSTPFTSGFPLAATRALVSERNALTHLLSQPPGTAPQLQLSFSRAQIVQSSFMATFVAYLETDARLDFRTRRSAVFEVEVLGSEGWSRLSFVPSASPPMHYRDLVARAWPTLVEDLRLGRVEGRAYSTGTLRYQPFPTMPSVYIDFQSRIRVRNGGETCAPVSIGMYPEQTEYLRTRLAGLRAQLRAELLNGMATPGSDIQQAARRLDNDAALLDAYLSLGMADAMTRSEMLRSAFRGRPGIGGLGFRSGDVQALVLREDAGDAGQVGGTPGLSLPGLGERLETRIAALASEIELAVQTAAPSFPYVEFVLAELRELRDQAQRVAIDSTYALNDSLVVSAELGLISNDIGQPGRIDDEELMVDLDYFTTPDAIHPSHGSLEVQPDGAFTYLPNPGFSGVDSFTYRLRAQVGDGTNPNVFSAPARVFLHVNVDMSDLLFANGFE